MRENYPLSVLPDAQSRFAMLFICFDICYSRKRITRRVASNPSARNLSRFRANARTLIIHLARPQRLRGKNNFDKVFKSLIRYQNNFVKPSKLLRIPLENLTFHIFQTVHLILSIHLTQDEYISR